MSAAAELRVGMGKKRGRDERDAKSSKCRGRNQRKRDTEGVHGGENRMGGEDGVMMQEKCRKQAFKELLVECK